MLDDLERSGLGWFWASDADGRLVYLSASVAERLDTPLGDLVGRPLAQIFQPAASDGRAKPLALRLGAHKAFSGLAVRAAARPDGTVLRLAGHPVCDASGSFAGFRGTGTDITEEWYREEETERLAKFDSLTGLANRHRMAHLIESTITAFRAAKRNCAVMMLDLDRFKQVNDTLGHAAGDELLKQVADRLGRAIDRDCEIGRLGGDEFQVMIPDLDDRGVLGEIAMKVIAMLRQPYSLDEGRCVIGCSVGIAIAPHDGVTREEVVRSADLALYAAKNGGRGQFRFFSGDLENESIFRRRLEADLGTGLSERQLFLKYQPVIEAGSRRVTSLEAKICWNHSQRGEIDEEEFARILEGSALVADIGRWAIREACAHAALWPDAVRVALAVPVPLFTAESFVEDVAAALSDADMAADRLELAISEAIFFGDADVVDRTLGRLFKLGVRLTLDEFGSGFSSLAYLRRAPFDTIRIDSRLVAEADREGGREGAREGEGERANGDESREPGLLRAIVALADALGMDTLAGGVETMALNDALVECGIGYVQGPIYYDPALRETVEGEIMGGDTGGGWRIDPSADRTARARRRTVLRKIHVIHDDHSYEVTLRNLSKTGALIQGLMDVPRGTQFVVDLGGGQLAVATVTRTSGDTQGLEFEQHLVEDGSGGLVTRNRVSPYLLASAGAPLAALSPGSYKAMDGGLGEGKSIPQFGYAPSVRSDQA
ncbi:MAG: EAL domain-containing protein [Alphaproteobacteria bacterium]|nr:EAL domain-containing protein [Alphaproteobacteria bacterium]